MAVFDVSGNVLCDQTPSGSYTDAQCTAAFMSYMAKKCTAYGMTGTSYENPSGLTSVSRSTPQDEMKLGLMVTAYREGLDIWSTKSQSFKVKGSHARTVEITNIAIDGENGLASVLAAAGYQRLGGKGGSLIGSYGYQKASIQLVDIDGTPVIMGLMGTGQTAYDNMNSSVKELCDVMSATLQGQTPSVGTNLAQLVSSGGGYAACVVPNVSGGYANVVTPAQLLARTYSVSDSPTASRIPASTTKTMTMLCALDFLKDPFETVQVKTVDISSGSGSTFYDGDVLNIMDALKIMMMESSNTLANVIARYTGSKILSFGLA